MKRIAFLISSLDTGGAQRAVSNITLNWPDEYEIDLILNSDKNIKYPYKGNIITLDVSEPKKRTSIFYQIKVFVKRIKLLKHLKKEKRYVACISFLDSANIANIFTKKRSCKTIISVRAELSQDHTFAYRFIVNPLVKLFYNKADWIVALSKGVEEDLKKNFSLDPQKTLTIYNCYDMGKMKSASKEQMIVFDEFTFINVGRLTYQKGQWHLIRAFAELIKSGYKCRLVILGDGELREYYQKMILDYGIQEFVDLKGFVDNPFVYLKAASCFVFPSMFEGFGNALIEAMACDLPVIATDFRSGAREILAPDTNIFEECASTLYAKYGVLVPVCEKDFFDINYPLTERERYLYEAMRQMLTDKNVEKKYRDMAQDCVKRFAAENIIDKWIDLIN